MFNKLYIIGNGFDLAHGMPTKFDPDFKNIACKNELYDFWEMYTIYGDEIWSDFENLLAHPDFNNLEEIFYGYEPDYLSDRESDRDGIILQAEVNGNLQYELEMFADNAEKSLNEVDIKPEVKKIVSLSGLYITFNYTHTLEKIYQIPESQILHIHGEVGKNNLVLGYPAGNFEPEEYFVDIREKGNGQYASFKIEEYISGIEDYYIRSAFEELLNKCKSFSKGVRIDLLDDFLKNNHAEIKEIIVFGHSCAIDFEYFQYLNNKFNNAQWTFYTHDEIQRNNVNNIIEKFRINNVILKNAT